MGGMIGEELSAESQLGQQSVSLCDDSGNDSVFHSARADGFAEHTIVDYENADGNPEEIVIAQDAAQAEEEAPVQLNGFGPEDDFLNDNENDDAPNLFAPDLPDEVPE